MDQYEIRVHQLRKMKFSIYFKLFLIIAALIVAGSLFYYFYDRSFFKISNFEQDNINKKVLFTYIYFFGFSILIIVVTIILLIIGNSKYKSFYLECLYNECKLEEIFLLDHKTNINKEISSFLLKAFKMTYLKAINSFSDASRKYSLDIINIRYFEDKKRRNGTLLSIQFDQEKPGFLQLSRDDKCYFNTYDSRDVVQYGTSAGSLLKGFHIFSTYKAFTYEIEQVKHAKKIVMLEKYFSTPLDIVFDNDHLYIFISNYSLKLEDNIFKKINNMRFSDKMESIKNFHQILFDVINMFDELFLKVDSSK